MAYLTGQLDCARNLLASFHNHSHPVIKTNVNENILQPSLLELQRSFDRQQAIHLAYKKEFHRLLQTVHRATGPWTKRTLFEMAHYMWGARQAVADVERLSIAENTSEPDVWLGMLFLCLANVE